MIALLCWAFLANVYAGEKLASYQAQKIPLGGVREMKIVGVRGQLNLRGRRGAKSLSLKVRHSSGRKYNDWYLSVERRGKTLFLEVFSVAYGAQWRTQVRTELWPEFDIDLEGAALPTTVGWREGSLNFSGWNASLEAAFLKGDATVTGGLGRVVLQPVQATVHVQGHIGDVSIKGDAGDLHLAHNRGAMDINWLNGQIEVRECQGKINLESRNAGLTVQGGGGQLGVQIDHGQANIEGFNGQINARGEQVRWNIVESAPASVNLVNASGVVGMAWRSGGAKVFLSSTRGSIDILHSDFLSPEWRDGQRVAEGTKSARSMGQVFIRNESGAIRWRQ